MNRSNHDRLVKSDVTGQQELFYPNEWCSKYNV